MHAARTDTSIPCHPHADGYPNPYFHTNSNRDANVHRDTHANRHRDPCADRHAQPSPRPPPATFSPTPPSGPLDLQGRPPKLEPYGACTEEGPPPDGFDHVFSAVGARYFNIAPNVESITVDFISGGDIGRARVIGAAGAGRATPCSLATWSWATLLACLATRMGGSCRQIRTGHSMQKSMLWQARISLSLGTRKGVLPGVSIVTRDLAVSCCAFRSRKPPRGLPLAARCASVSIAAMRGSSGVRWRLMHSCPASRSPSLDA